MRIGGLPKGAYATKLMHSEREPLSLPLSGLKMTRCFLGRRTRVRWKISLFTRLFVSGGIYLSDYD